MAPPPFKVIGPVRQPLTVEETADALGVSPLQMEEVLAAVAAVIGEGGRTGVAAKRKGAAVKSVKAAKAVKSASAAKVGGAPLRRTRSAAKAAARSRR